MEENRIEKHIDLKASPSRVWKALTDHKEFGQWFGVKLEGPFVAGKTVADLAISGDTDDLFYDSTSRSVYISCGEGFIDVVAQSSPDKYERIHQIATRAGARTSFFSADRRQFYLAVPQYGSDSAELRIYAIYGQ